MIKGSTKGPKVKFTPRRWTIKGPTRRSFERVAQRAMRMLVLRNTQQNQTAMGRRLPRVESEGYMVIAEDDERYKGTAVKPGYVGGGYTEVKRRLGIKPLKNGQLSGAMWESLTPQVRLSKRKGATIRLYFKGSTITKEETVRVSSVKTRRERNKKIRTRVANRDKATLLQHEGGTRSGRRLFTLMALSSSEIGLLRDDIVAKLRIFA